MDNQKVKLQISSDIEDVTRVSSALLEEALMHVKDLTALISTAKDLLKETNIANPNDVQKLKTSLQFLNSTRIPVSKIDNRLADVVAIVDGLEKIVTGTRPDNIEQKEEVKDDNVATG